jgi:hypothetical protein
VTDEKPQILTHTKAKATAAYYYHSQATPESLWACRLSHSIDGRFAGRDAANGSLWFMLGMMVAWTPGLLALALMLRQH